MKRLIYTDLALVDFDNILQRISLDNPRAAVELGDGFMNTCKLIAQNPEIGVLQGKPDAPLRMFTHRGYAIYYDNLEHSVEILRFLRPSLDVHKQTLR